MKNSILLLLTIATLSLSLGSCNQYKSFANASKLSELSGNPFMYNLSKSVLRSLGTFVIQQGLKGTVGKLNLLTPLSNIFTSGTQIDAFKSILGSTYGIPSDRMGAFGKLATVKDLVGFVGKNGRKFNFYQ